MCPWTHPSRELTLAKGMLVNIKGLGWKSHLPGFSSSQFQGTEALYFLEVRGPARFWGAQLSGHHHQDNQESLPAK